MIDAAHQTDVRRETAESKRVLAVMRHPLGGIRTYILYNYPTLQEAGYRFTFLAPASEPFQAFQEDLRDWEGVEFVEVTGPEHKNSLRRAVRRQLRSRRYCLVHSHGFTAAVATTLANLGIGVPHLLTSHDVLRPQAQFPGVLGSLKLRVLSHLICRADRIVAVSHDARENHLAHFPALRIRSEKLITIVHGIDTARFQDNDHQTEESLRSRLGIDQGVFLIGFLGRFMEQKGFLVLLEAMDTMLAANPPTRDFHLLAVGSGDMRVNYGWDLDKRPRLKGRVTFANHVPNVTAVLPEIDLLAMPSLWEACGLLAMEAMCAGVPVLGSDCIGLREVLAGTPSVMVPAGDPEALATALRDAIDTPCTQAARAFAPEARRRFDVRLCATALLALFDELQGSRRGNRLTSPSR